MQQIGPLAPSHRTRTIALGVLQAITILAAIIAITVTRADPDLWGHVRYGADMLQSWEITTADPYSFTSDRPWINHEWLAEILFALAYEGAGARGLIALKLTVALIAIGLMLHVARREGASGQTLVIIGVLALAAMLPRAQQIRPQLFSVLWFAALIAILQGAECGRSRVLFLAPLVMMAWANTHGGWLVGCATMGAWTLGHVWQLRSEHPRRWIVPLAACGLSVLATLANPYGTGLWSFLRETVGPSRRYIVEWGPITGVPMLLVPWLLFCALTVVLLRRNGIPANPARALIPIAWAVASAKISRLDAFFAMSVLGFLSGPLGAWLGERRIRRSTGAITASPAPTWRLRLAALLVLGIFAAPFWRTIMCIDVHGPTMPEPDAMQFIQKAGLRGRMVTYFDWGQYAIWHLPPGLVISMDGRRETVYQPSTVDSHLDLYLGTPSGLSYLRHLDPHYVWLPNASPAVAHLVQDGWTPIYDGGVSTILSRETFGLRMAALENPPSREPPTVCRCFPGP